MTRQDVYESISTWRYQFEDRYLTHGLWMTSAWFLNYEDMNISICPVKSSGSDLFHESASFAPSSAFKINRHLGSLEHNNSSCQNNNSLGDEKFCWNPLGMIGNIMKIYEKYLTSSEKSKVKFAKECPAVRTDRGLTGKERLQTSHLTRTDANFVVFCC